MENYQKIKNIALKEGISLFGVADISNLKSEFFLEPKEILQDLNKAICIGYRLSAKILNTLIDKPNKIYFFHYRLVNSLLDATALKISAFIQESGCQSLPIPASQIIDWERNIGAVSHKLIGYYAGLGFWGRNNLLVHPEFGSQIRLATILTNIPLKTNKPLTLDCGNCSTCLSVCPAKAIKKKKEDFDLKTCAEKLKEFSKAENLSQQICGLCVKSCSGKLS